MIVLHLKPHEERRLRAGHLWVYSNEIDTARGVPETSPRAIRDDYRWLPATPASLRLLTTASAIPEGFTPTTSINGR